MLRSRGNHGPGICDGDVRARLLDRGERGVARRPLARDRLRARVEYLLSGACRHRAGAPGGREGGVARGRAGAEVTEGARAAARRLIEADTP